MRSKFVGTLAIAFLLLAIVPISNASWFSFDYGNCNYLPVIETSFDASDLLGTWYLYATNKEDYATACAWYTVADNGNGYYDVQAGKEPDGEYKECDYKLY